MIRMYEYEPRVDVKTGVPTTFFRDFQNWLFSHPYTFLWDFPNDKVVIYGVAYRISSMQHIPDDSHVTCLCVCGGGSGAGTGSKIVTDVSLHGEGKESDPLGVRLSKRGGNRLQILSDGCYVGPDAPYIPPTVTLSSSIPEGEYLFGESLDDMVLTVDVVAGSDPVIDVRIYAGAITLHVFSPVEEGSKTYTFNLPTAVVKDTDFKAVVSDGMEYPSNIMVYTFAKPVFCGVSNSMTVTETDILSETPFQVTGSSFDFVYEVFNSQHLWMCCPDSRIITKIDDENGFNITAAFKKTAITLTLAGDSYNYTLYVFDVKVTGSHYTVTFKS